jgi:hypothetical protein
MQVLSAVFGSLGMAGAIPFPAAYAPPGQAPGVGAQPAQQGDVETRTIEMHFDFPPPIYAGHGLPPARSVPLVVPSRGAGQGSRARGDSLATMGNFLRHLERRMQAHSELQDAAALFLYEIVGLLVRLARCLFTGLFKEAQTQCWSWKDGIDTKFALMQGA